MQRYNLDCGIREFYFVSTTIAVFWLLSTHAMDYLDCGIREFYYLTI